MPRTSKTKPSIKRKNPVTAPITGSVRGSAPPAVAAYAMLALSGALAAALACGSDTAVDDGNEPVGNAGSGSSGSGSSGSGNAGGMAAAGAANVSGTGGGAVDSAGAGGTGDEEVVDEFFIAGCTTGDASELCSWALSSEFTGTPCTPGEPMILGCCDCGTNSDLLRVCDGDTSCSYGDAIGSDRYCGACPLTEFTCPPSGVFSALAGSYPSFTFDEATQEVMETAGPPSSCQPKLVTVSDSSGTGSAGTVGFDQVHPVLVANCSRCHAAETGLGGFLMLPPFADADVEAAYEAAQYLGGPILAQINAGVMPPDTCQRTAPGGEGCVSADDFNLIRSWFAAGSPR